MGCGVSQEAVLEPVEVPDIESGYPPPAPPTGRKAAIFKEGDCAAIEANARRAPQTLAGSYRAVIDYVTQDTCNDVQKVRAIYSWLAAQPILTARYSQVKDARSPEGYMKTIRQGNGSYTTFFALLCRAARIPCVILHGVGKAATYEVGDQDVSGLHSSWTAVHVDGSWRLVHVFWALVGLQGFSRGGWTVVEEGGETVRQKKKASAGKTVHKQDDFWFLTDPDQFIFFCLPKNSRWQLLPSPWSLDKFVNVPHFSINYFDSGFELVSRHAAILRAEKGRCDITFHHPENVDAELDHALLFDERGSKRLMPQSFHLDRYVIQYGTLHEKTLRVRFPVPGVYRVKVTGSGERRSMLASFRLECKEVFSDVQPYPDNPKIGYGHNKLAEDIGLTSLSHVQGIVVVHPGETVHFHLHCKEGLELQTRLLHRGDGDRRLVGDLSAYVRQERRGTDVTIVATVPVNAQNPEYALKVSARLRESGGGYDNVLNYLLTHAREEGGAGWEREDGAGTSRSHYTRRGTREEGQLRHELMVATTSRQRARLEKVLREWQRAGLPDNAYVERAKRLLISLHEQELQAAIQERDPQTLDDAIESAKASIVLPQLEEREVLEEAESLRGLLHRLNIYLHRILELKPTTVSEMHSYIRPRPLVHSVMKATYLLLGEEERQLQQWKFIQKLLRRRGRDSIIRRIQDFDLTHVSLSCVSRAEAHLQHCSMKVVRQTSAGAGTFYIWSSNIIREGRAFDRETASRADGSQDMASLTYRSLGNRSRDSGLPANGSQDNVSWVVGSQANISQRST